MHHQLLDQPRTHVAAEVRRRNSAASDGATIPPPDLGGYQTSRDSLKGSLLGPKFSNEEIRRFLDAQPAQDEGERKKYIESFKLD